MMKILKGSRFAMISHRFQQLILILIWGFRIFSNSRTIMIRSKSTKWKWNSNHQTIGYKKRRGCWFTHFTMTTVNLSYQLGSGLVSGEIAIFGFGFFYFALEIVILREELSWVLGAWKWKKSGTNGSGKEEKRKWSWREEKKEGIVKNQKNLWKR